MVNYKHKLGNANHEQKNEGVSVMPLSLADAGRTFYIHKITGRDETQRFLESLGFVIGGSVTVISEMGGNMILKVKDSRIALDKKMAGRIMVQ